MKKTKRSCANYSELVDEQLQFSTFVPHCALGELLVPFGSPASKEEKGTALRNWVKQWNSLPGGRWTWRLGKVALIVCVVSAQP